MKLTRRQTVIAGLSVVGVATLPLPSFAANVPLVGLPDEFTRGASVGSGNIILNTPEIAENGNTVPIHVSAPGAVEIRIYAMGNPVPGVAAVTFGPLAAAQSASTRVRLAGTQDVVAIAKMQDGNFISTINQVKVTIGGCGG
ncbi:MAG: thiosulfate oxidation carrier protein SoxY [Aestuariivita sp.]|nr:thiosulfate oxidation carrier protein SoxY [Aestuariivita sp.]